MNHHPDLIPVSPTGGYRHRLDKREPGKSGPRVSVTDKEALILRSLATRRDVLEIGTGTGLSARHMDVTAASLTTVDIDPWVHENVWPTLPGRVDALSVRPSQTFFEMVFIDGDHDSRAVSEDIAYALRCCVHSGLIVLHDFKDDRVRTAARNSGLDFYAIDTEYGLGLAVIP